MFTRTTNLGFLTLLLLSTTSALAQETQLPEVVISANQAPIEENKVGASVTVLKGDELRARGLTTAADALRYVPGVSVGQTGNAGTLTQVRIRGAEANHTLVVIDGVPAQRLDFGDFDWADFLLDDIDRIEVVRGPQSGIAGANASSGLISIYTKSGKGLKRPEAEYRLEGGMRDSHRESASFRGQFGAFYGAMTFQNRETKGYNIAREGSERDGNRAKILTAKGGVDIGNLNIEGSVRHVDRVVQFDSEGFVPAPNPIFDSYAYDKFRSTQARVTATHSAFDGRFVQRLGASWVDQYFNDLQIDLFGPGSNFIIKSDANFFDYKATTKYDTRFFGGEQHSFTILLDQAKEHYETNFGALANRTRRGVAGEHVVDLPWGFTLATALRHDFNDAFKDATTWRVTGAQRVANTGTRFHSSVGKAVTNPTFTEQFGFNVFPIFTPNPNLQPETSMGWDFGVQQTWWNGKLITDVTYFSTNVENAIATNATTVVNIAGISHRRGIETSIKYVPTDLLSFDANYTYTNATRPNDQIEIRRPRHVASLNATAFSPDKRGRATIGTAYNGKASDGETPATPGRVDLAAYTLVHAILSYDVTPTTTVYARAENVFDKKFEEVWGYRAQGFTAYAGMKVKFGGNN